MRVNPFIEDIKKGRRVKAGGSWIPTHKAAKRFSSKPLSPSYVARAEEVMAYLADTERIRPSGPGQTQPVDIKSKKGVSAASYKWLGKDDSGKRVAIVGVWVDAGHYLSIDLTSAIPEAFLHDSGEVFRLAVPLGLHRVFSEILDRTPAKFIGKEEVRPSSGVSDQQILDGGGVLIGSDESGRGCGAGPIVSASLMLTRETVLPDVFDSKQLVAGERRKIYEQLQASGIPYAISKIDAAELDEIGITAANARVIQQSVLDCEVRAGRTVEHVLVDGSTMDLALGNRKVTFLTKGEMTSRAIAAASIIATCAHEDLMLELAKAYPGWNFEKNRGYLDPEHIKLLGTIGLSPVHRKSFNPMKQMLKAQAQLDKTSNHPSIGL